MSASGDPPTTHTGSDGLRIVHVMRAPVGGLFRHVVDLARAQAEAGHAVGLIADSSTGGEDAARALAKLEPSLALGLSRLPMRRSPHPDDISIAWRIAVRLAKLAPHIAHGHGAKGGLYVRAPALAPFFPTPPKRMARIYTPHGGSLHYPPATLGGRLLAAAERRMALVTDFMPFESEFARRRFIEKVCAVRPRRHEKIATTDCPVLPCAALP
ncbi:MAG: glycosyltransferase family 4 protein, partial [Methylocystis sp.]|nr:glycosyltransferase family 4 protein [Methylocystis sp.]